MVEETEFCKFKILSEYVCHYISDRIKKKTKVPLEYVGDLLFYYDKTHDTENMRATCTHNNNIVIFLVSYRQGMLIDVDKHKKEFYKELNYVADYIIDFIKNGYKHP